MHGFLRELRGLDGIDPSAAGKDRRTPQWQASHVLRKSPGHAAPGVTTAVSNTTAAAPKEIDITLGQLEEWYVLGGRCARCRHKGLFDRWEQARRLGKRVYLTTLESKLVCTGCQNRIGNKLTIARLRR
ncbi:hypothetical protein ACTJK5_09785 [Agrobacterium sp. 22094]|uniref:hypothetical protein n=1 Tax=Agrobacterium sp. 22094 TaxID=3453872 RepID=UPI003F874C17